jgi:hypothetical protein
MTRIELLQQSKADWIQFADQQIGLAAMYRKHGDPGEEARARGRAMKAYARADLRQAAIDKLLAQSRNKTQSAEGKEAFDRRKAK